MSMSKLFFLPVLAVMLVGSQCEPPKKKPVDQVQEVSEVITLTGFNAEYMTDVCIDAKVSDKLEDARLHQDCQDIVEVLDPGRRRDLRGRNDGQDRQVGHQEGQEHAVACQGLPVGTRSVRAGVQSTTPSLRTPSSVVPALT